MSGGVLVYPLEKSPTLVLCTINGWIGKTTLISYVVVLCAVSIRLRQVLLNEKSFEGLQQYERIVTSG